MRFRKLFFIIILVIISSHVGAQEEILPIHRRGFISAGVNAQIWRVQYRALINQISFPLTVYMLINDRFNISVSNTPAHSWRDETGRITDFSDTWVQGNYVFWDDKAMINLGIGMPTGKTRLDSVEFAITEMLSRNIFSFQLPVYGQGLCGVGSFGIAYPVKEGLVIGASAQYLYRRVYHPVQYSYGESVGLDKLYDKEYDPGDEVSGSLGFDIRLTENMKIMFDGIYTYYWSDYLDGDLVYRAGSKITMNLGYFYRYNSSYFWTHITFRYREKNSLYQGLIVDETRYNSRYQLDLDMIYKFLSFPNGEVFGLGIGRFYEPLESDKGLDIIGGIGMRVDYKIFSRGMLNFQLKFFSGGLKLPLNREIIGIEASIGTVIEY